MDHLVYYTTYMRGRKLNSPTPTILLFIVSRRRSRDVRKKIVVNVRHVRSTGQPYSYVEADTFSLIWPACTGFKCFLKCLIMFETFPLLGLISKGRYKIMPTVDPVTYILWK